MLSGQALIPPQPAAAEAQLLENDFGSAGFSAGPFRSLLSAWLACFPLFPLPSAPRGVRIWAWGSIYISEAGESRCYSLH